MKTKTLKEIRTQKGIFQETLARQASISQSEVSHIEQGRLFPRKAIRERIEAVLGTQVDWVSTRLTGPALTGRTDGESPEDGVIRAMSIYLKSAQRKEAPERLSFLKNLIKRFEKELNNGKRC